MQTIAVQPERSTTKAECPQCRNREGIKDGALSLRHRRRSYDIWTDSFGLLRCPRCAYRAPWAEFHTNTTTTISSTAKATP